MVILVASDRMGVAAEGRVAGAKVAGLPSARAVPPAVRERARGVLKRAVAVVARGDAVAGALGAAVGVVAA